MRYLLLLALSTAILLGTTAGTGHAAEQITVEQLQARLGAEQGRSDGALAHRISSLELTERLSDARLQRLEAELPGKKSRQALVILADFSAFLAPPPSEIPDLATPAHAVGLQIAEKAVQYLIQVIPALPNFLATRITTRFEDTSTRRNESDTEGPGHPMEWAGVSSETVMIRHGREVVEHADPRRKTGTESTSPNMMSRGEFGAVLIGLIDDAFRGTVSWSRWETRGSKPVAVFRYSVLQKNSHFEVFERIRGRLLPVHPAYHGEIAVDPGLGTVLGLTVQGDWKPGDFNVRSDILVEFAPFDIGGKTYYCPSHSIAVSVLHPELPFATMTNAPNRVQEEETQTELNDVQFSNYHLFRAEMRILPDDKPEPVAAPPAPETSTPDLGHGPSQ